MGSSIQAPPPAVEDKARGGVQAAGHKLLHLSFSIATSHSCGRTQSRLHLATIPVALTPCRLVKLMMAAGLFLRGMGRAAFSHLLSSARTQHPAQWHGSHACCS